MILLPDFNPWRSSSLVKVYARVHNLKTGNRKLNEIGTGSLNFVRSGLDYKNPGVFMYYNEETQVTFTRFCEYLETPIRKVW
jgi:hypothetical protein